MELVIEFLIEHGLWGMFIGAFLAGSIVLINSEIVMLALLAAGLDPDSLLLFATLGNTLGGLLNYGMGTLGREEWIERFVKIKPEKLERGKRYVRRYGAWAGLLSWVPVVGELVTVALGYLRVNAVASALSITVGKFLRYQILISAYTATLNAL